MAFHSEGSTQQDITSEFEQFYLRQATSDFADDIEKLRKTTDFKDSSVPVLIQALKQGAANFPVDQQRRIINKQH